jgi:trans-aconitate methyltransferase
MKHNLGKFYDETSEFQQAQFDHLKTLIASHSQLESVRSLLDIGAGTGKRTKECLTFFPQLETITALEPDPDMYAQAVEYYNDPAIQYLQKSSMHIGQMPREHPFDAILSHWAMHWIADKDQVFSDLDRIVEKDALLFISTCEKLPDILMDIDDYIRKELGITSSSHSPFHYLNREEWEAVLQKHGWNIVKTDHFQVGHAVKSAKTYLEHWFTTSTGKFTYNRHLVEINQLSLSDLLMLMERKYGDSDNEGLLFEEDVLFLIARKGG